MKALEFLIHYIPIYGGCFLKGEGSGSIINIIVTFQDQHGRFWAGKDAIVAATSLKENHPLLNPSTALILTLPQFEGLLFSFIIS